jgi:hypothetical protein
VFCLWFTKNCVSPIELNLELKYQANDIKISQIFIYGVISPPTNKIRIFNWFWGGLLMVHSKLCFCGRIESTFKFHLISFLFFSFYATDMIEDNNKMKYNFFFLRCHRHKYVWSICTNPKHSIWSSWIHSYLLRGRNIWEVFLELAKDPWSSKSSS